MRTIVFLITAGVWSTTVSAQPAPPSVYAPPELPTEAEGTNQGAVGLDFSVSYFTDYIHRGVELFEAPGSEDQLNLQFDGKISFDLGKLPHPFVQVFVNVAENDPVSNFQEIRPTVGFDWMIKPLVISAGYTTYLYPDRDDFETSEVFLRLGLDQNITVGGQYIPTPYVMGAYDFDLYDGVYLEAGLEYVLRFEDIGLALNFVGNVAYVSNWDAYPVGNNGPFAGIFTTPQTTEPTLSGLQHWQVGVIGEYSLNNLLNISPRYGEWLLRGYLFYTSDFDADINATDQIWGGAGITFRY
jgi:hypothetical protein